jgi:hypothetical protein
MYEVSQRGMEPWVSSFLEIVFLKSFLGEYNTNKIPFPFFAHTNMAYMFATKCGWTSGEKERTLYSQTSHLTSITWVSIR